jgi:general secretion pathway protein K
MALVVVLWVLAFLGVVFTAFTFSMRTELAAAGNFKEEAETYYIAEAGIYRAAAEIINADRNNPPDSSAYDALDEHWHTNPEAYENVPLGRGRYWVKVTDEEGKIPLNGATDAMLRRLLSNSGVKDERRVSTIVDSIQDWRDADTLHRMSGAEDDYYLTLPVPYKARNGNFETIDEVLLVKGMTPDILYGNVANPERQSELTAQPPWERKLGPGEYLGIARHVSVFGAGRVNVNTASPEVLLALGMTPVDALAVLERRKANPFRSLAEITSLLASVGGAGQPGAPGPPDPQHPLSVLTQMGGITSQSFSVESAARVEGSRLTCRVSAILRRDGPAGRPKLSIRLWTVNPREGA